MTEGPIELDDALRAVLARATPLDGEDVALGDALGRWLAEDVVADSPVQGFDNSAMDGFAVRAADTAAARPGSPAALEVLHVLGRTRRGRHRVIEDQIAEIGKVTDREPALSEPAGHAAHEIIESTQSKRPSLLICGRRGLSGIKALGSVSERVVHRAACSVLLVPAGNGP